MNGYKMHWCGMHNEVQLHVVSRVAYISDVNYTLNFLNRKEMMLKQDTV